MQNPLARKSDTVLEMSSTERLRKNRPHMIDAHLDIIEGPKYRVAVPSACTQALVQTNC